MLCEHCHKKEATVHYTEIVNGRRTEEHLCADCAGKAQLGTAMPRMDFFRDSFFGDSFFRDFWDEPVRTLRRLACPTCGTTLDTVREEGRLGCPDCYETFRESLAPFFGKNQEGGSHTGMTPETAAPAPAEEKKETADPHAAELREKLAALVKEENYEEAAKVRDELKAWEADHDHQ